LKCLLNIHKKTFAISIGWCKGEYFGQALPELYLL